MLSRSNVDVQLLNTL